MLEMILLMAIFAMGAGAFILGMSNRATLGNVQRQTNGMLEEIRKAARALGKLEGQAEEKAKHPDDV
jgi:hypothetical protein